MRHAVNMAATELAEAVLDGHRSAARTEDQHRKPVASSPRGAEAQPRATFLEGSFPFRELSLVIAADRRTRDPVYGVHRWSKGPLPVVGVVYDPERDLAVWADITKLLRECPDTIERGPYSVRIPSTAILSATTLRDSFQRNMAVHFLRADAQPITMHEWAHLLCSEREEDQERGLELLVASPEQRRSRVTCQILLSRTFHLHPGPLRFAIQVLAGYYPHGGAIIPSKDLWWFCRRVSGRWTISDFALLLDKVDDNGTQGAFGWAIKVLLHSVFDPEDVLLGIVSDEESSHTAKFNAILCLGDFFGGARTLTRLWNNNSDLRQAGLGEPVNWTIGEVHERLLDDDLLPNHDEGCPVCGTSAGDDLFADLPSGSVQPSDRQQDLWDSTTRLHPTEAGRHRS